MKKKSGPGKSGKGNPTVVSVDAAAITGPAEFWRYGLGQGGLSDDPMISGHTALLKNLKPRYIRIFLQEYFEVTPGYRSYDWKKLDAAVNAVLATGAKPMMAVCFRPKRLYPENDHAKVHPSDYAEWEELMTRMTRHYNIDRQCGIEYWEVFNEPDLGEKGGCPGLFTAADYLIYYDHTVKGLLAGDPSIKVGGPAVSSCFSPILESLLDHCSELRVPLHFVSWHIYTNDPADAGRSVLHVRGLLDKRPALECQTILNEWNISLAWDRMEPEFQPCFILETTAAFVKTGLDFSCYYHIRDFHVSLGQFQKFMSARGAADMARYWNVLPFYGGLFDYQGTIRPAYFVFKLLSKLTGSLVDLRIEGGKIDAFAARDAELKTLNIILWNFPAGRPAAADVVLKIANLGAGNPTFKRYRFDAGSSGDREEQRLRPEHSASCRGESVTDRFRIAPFGIHFVSIILDP